MNQSQFLGTFHRHHHLDAILSELDLCQIIIQRILLTELEYGTYPLRREHCNKHCHVVLCIMWLVNMALHVLHNYYLVNAHVFL